MAVCENVNHEHDSTVGPCPQCGAPSHYDTSVEDYRHDDAGPCFLQESSATPCTKV